MKSFLNNKQFSQGIRKAAVMTAAIVSITAASASWADVITMTRNGTYVGGNSTGAITGYSSVHAGQFKFTVNSSDNSNWGANTTFGAFCIDIANTLVPGKVTYNIALANGTNVLADPVFARVNWLFDSYTGGNPGGTNTGNDVALQLALWEIINENSSNTLNLKKGVFTSASFSGARTTANSWLTALNAANVASNYRSTTWDFYVLTAKDPSPSQGLITWREKDPGNPPAEVSEPGTLLLLSLGLGAVFFCARRRNSAYFSSFA